MQEALFVAAATAHVLADKALAAAIVACSISGGTLCPAVVEAMAIVALSVVALAEATQALEECLTRELARGGEGSVPGGGSGDGIVTCWYEIIEVSRDGGQTWELESISVTCDT
jgi:hypothetical protein